MITNQISKSIILLIMISLAHFVNGQETKFDHEVVYCETCLDVVPLDFDLSYCFRWEDMDGNFLSHDMLRTCEINAGLYRLIKTNGANIIYDQTWYIHPEFSELSLLADKYEICGEGEDIRLIADTWLVNREKLIWSNNVPGNTYGKTEVYVKKPGIYEVSLKESLDGCLLKAFVEIKATEEICSNGLDDDCDGLVDCDDGDCSDPLNVCSCEHLEIVPVFDLCDCALAYFLYIKSTSEIDRIIWDTGVQSESIRVNTNRIYTAQVFFTNGKHCHVEYDFKMDAEKPEYLVVVTSEETDVEVICDNENNEIYSPICKTSNITLKLLIANTYVCLDQRIEWFLVTGEEEFFLGDGIEISLSDNFEGSIDIRRCDESIFQIEKKLHNEIPEIIFRGGCRFDQDYYGQYGWDDTMQQEFRDHGYYDFGRFFHPKGHRYYSPILSLLRKQSQSIFFEESEILKPQFERDPSFYLNLNSNSSSIVINDEKMTYPEIESTLNILLTSKDRTVGGNAQFPYTVEVKDNCNRKVGQLKVVSGVPQKINVTIVPVHIVATQNYGSGVISGDVLEPTLFSSVAEFEFLLNEHAFNQIFRKIDIRKKRKLEISDWQFIRNYNNNGIDGFWTGLADLYRENTGIDLRPSDNILHSDFIYFVFDSSALVNSEGTPIFGYTVGYSTFSTGTYENLQLGAEGLIADNDLYTFIHEIGHGLQLCHPFVEEDGSFGPACKDHSLMANYKKETTCDHMSYSNNTQSFLFNHWLRRL